MKFRSTWAFTPGVLIALSAACSDAPTTAPDGEVGSDTEAVTAAVDATPPVQSLLPGESIPQFVDALPTFTGRRVRRSSLTVTAVEFQQQVLPASVYAKLPAQYSAGTYLWGYDVDHSGAHFPATTIEAVRGTATKITYANSLQTKSGARPFLANYLVGDQTVHWADPLKTSSKNHCYDGPPLAQACTEPYAGPIPMVVHMHGAEVASQFDGHPLAWFSPANGRTGPAFGTNQYTYPNEQEATTLWFHDHALGRTRLNVYAGLAGMYLLRDARDTGAAGNPIGLPAGEMETELAIADRQFDTNGQLFFPNGVAGNPDGINGPPPNPETHPYWNPEFFGDVITVNGKAWPYLDVKARRYRFRVLNASNARFYRMRFSPAAGATRDPATNTAPTIWQIGSDGGLLNAPVRLNDDADPSSPAFFMAPGERADIVVDFHGLEGQTFTLTNDAVAPFPSGDPPDPATSGRIMQFRVGARTYASVAAGDPTTDLASPAARTSLRAKPIVDIAPTPARPADLVRQLVLVEVEGAGGPEEVLLNNTHYDGLRAGTKTSTPDARVSGVGVTGTEAPRVGSTEVWEIANLTEDAHPIHIHLAQFQVLGRQALKLQGPDGDTAYRADWDAQFPGGTYGGVTYTKGTFIPGFGPPMSYLTRNAAGAVGGNVAFAADYFDGAAFSADATELGWKDTIRAYPKQVTRIVVRWAPQGLPVTSVAPGMKNLFSFDPTAGPGYVWHCHILDHEDNEMMRPMLMQK